MSALHPGPDVGAGAPVSRYVLSAAADSAQGQVAALGGVVNAFGGYIAEFDQYDDRRTQRFFARVVFEVGAETPYRDIASAIGTVADDFAMDWRLRDCRDPARVMILVSKTDHCLRDILYRHQRGELAMTITAIVSNHADLAPLAEAHGLRFVHLPITPATKDAQEARLLALIEETASELLVLARYMQVLSDRLSRALYGRVINIHHSFLPGFKGAKPYRQAYERGVKQIGATAHYVTADLDEGPIIEQGVERVDHRDTVRDLTARGRDCESRTLVRALQLHIQGRVFLYRARTVVLG